MPVTTDRVLSSIFFTLVTVWIIFGVQSLGYGQQNNLSAQEITPVSERTPQVRDAIVSATGVNAADINETHLRTVTNLDLSGQSITLLKVGDFSGLTALTHLNLYDNQLRSLPPGIFKGLTSLNTLRLDKNAIEPFPIIVSLKKVAEGQFKAVLPTGALFDIVVPIKIVNGTITGNAKVIIPKGSVESRTLTLSRPVHVTSAYTVDIGTLPECPPGHTGCILLKSVELPIEVISVEVLPEPVVPDVPVNTAPRFREGTVTTRVVMDNIAVGVPLGRPVSAIDSDGDLLTYTLGGVDANYFDLDSMGYIKTKVPLDNRSRDTYYVTITVSDGLLSSSQYVVITVVDANDIIRAPGFIPVSERTPAVRDAIVSAVPGVNDAHDVTLSHLATITDLYLRSRNISKLKSGDFSGLIELTNLNLYGNNLITLPDGIFYGLTELSSLRLGRNAKHIVLPVYLQQVGDDQYKIVVPTGAPFDMNLPVSVTNGIISDGATTVRVPQGSMESRIFGVTSTRGSSVTPAVSITTLPMLPREHFGYTFAQSTVYDRTPQVAQAITDAIPGINDPRYVTDIDLVTITALYLNGKGIKSLKPGDFAGMPLLSTIFLHNNGLTSLPNGIFNGLKSLTRLYLSGNHLSFLPIGAYDGLSSLTHLDLSNNEFTDLSADFFQRLPVLSNFNISGNKLTSLSTGLFEGTSGFEHLHMNSNSVDPLPLLVRLEKIGDDQFKAVIPSGAPLTLTLPISVQNGEVVSGASSVMILAGTVESRSLTVTRTANTNDAVTVAIGTLPSRPEFHTGYVLVKSNAYPLEMLSSINRSPVFLDSNFTIRTIAENTVSGVNIGTAITATDVNKDTVLVYSLGGADASSFELDSKTGQLRTKAALDYETKPIYTVIVTATDGIGESTSINVLINVSNINEAPMFAEGSNTSRSVAENTGIGINIGSAVTATDPDGSMLTYSLSGIDAAAFSIDRNTGQLRTSTPFDYETKASYTFTVIASDGNGMSASIGVRINISNRNELPGNNPPVFSEGSSTARTVAENTRSGVNIGMPIVATDPDGNILTYSLSGTDAAAFSIDSATGQLRTSAPLDYETKAYYTVTVIAYDGKGSGASITVGINISDRNELPGNNVPVFTEGTSTTRSIAENAVRGVNIGTPVSATDADRDALTYRLNGTDAYTFTIDTITGQLRTRNSLDYETKSTYSVIVNAFDGNGGSAFISVTINIIDINESHVSNVNQPEDSNINELNPPDPNNRIQNNAPVFTEGSSTTRSIAENTEISTYFGTPVVATDADGETLTYYLGGTDAGAFSIDIITGQLQTRTALDYETKSSYTVSVNAFDGNGGSASIAVTINIIDMNESDVSPISGPEGSDINNLLAPDPNNPNTNRAPVFTEGSSTTRSIAENTASGINVGTPVSATDADGDTLVYRLNGIDAASFSLDSTTGQLRTYTSLDYEAKSTYTVTIIAFDGNGGSASISVTISISDINEQPINESPDPINELPVNRAPVFTEGSSTSRSIVENIASGFNIGTPVSATDADGDTLIYSLSGTNANAFRIDGRTGQLKTSAALDYETKSSYSVTITVSDGTLTDTITVTINITDINENDNEGEGGDRITPITNRVPVFTEGSSTTRSIAENTASSTSIGTPVSAADPDEDTLTYNLGGTDSASFSIVSTSGQLKTSAALDYEEKTSYSVTITATDGYGGSASIAVTINIIDINEPNDSPINEDEGSDINNLLGSDPNTPPQNRAPVFTEGSTTTRSIAENTNAGVDIGDPVSATDADGDTLTYSVSGTDASTIRIVSTTGQLWPMTSFDYETKTSYSVTVTADDGKDTATIDVTVEVTNVNEVPVFTEGSSTTRSIAENTESGMNIGSAVSATDPDGDTVGYSITVADAKTFAIDSITGQLKTNAALDYETKSTYSVTVTASDSNDGSASITVTINITDVNENGDGEGGEEPPPEGAPITNRPPVFSEGSSTTRSIAENTASGTNIGSAVAATDADGDTLSYSLTGTDAKSFEVGSSTGQLKTNAALDYETKISYTVIVTANDGNGGSASITVTINITDVNENLDVEVLPNPDPIPNAAPVFTEGSSTTRSIGENTESGVNIGTPVAATDANGHTITYSLGGTNSASFGIDSTDGQLKTSAALDYETKTSYSVTVTADDGNGGSTTITVTINITDENDVPVFSDGSSTTRSIGENAASGVNIGTPVAATDSNGDTLTYTLGGSDSASFGIVSTSGQLQTSAALDYETTTSYSVTVTANDGNGGSASITVTISITDGNDAPVFSVGGSTTRSIAENTASGVNIGTPVTATDANGDTLTYSLGGTDSASFGIVSTSGQLQTSAALNYENKNSYSVTVTASDGNGGSASIDVTIDVTNVNEAPVFQESNPTRSLSVRTSAGTKVGTPVTATDPDGDTLTYSLLGTGRYWVNVDSSTGQLSAAQHFNLRQPVTTRPKQLAIYADDGTTFSKVKITLQFTNANPVFADGSETTRSVAENTESGTNFGTAVAATDADGGTLTYSLGGDDANSFSIVSGTGQLQTSAALDYEIKSTYTVKVSVADENSGSASITVTINVTDVDESESQLINAPPGENIGEGEGEGGGNSPPVFSEGSSTTRSVVENTPSGTNIGTAVAATDLDGDTLTYTLGGTDAASFSIDSTTGQLQTSAALDYETTTSYSVTVTADDGNGGSAIITVTINITDIVGNEAPIFTEGSSTTRSIAENMNAGIDIGSPVSATDPEGDTITYSLSGDDADDIRIGFNGLLWPMISFDYETKNSYSITVTATDANGNSTNISVTINITDVNDAPVFTDGTSTTRAIGMNQPSNSPIGSPVSATDQDDDTLTYKLIGDNANLVKLDAQTGQLKSGSASWTSGTKVTLEVSDGSLTDTIVVTLNIDLVPKFSDGSSATRSVAEDAAVGSKVGDPISATDPGNLTLTYEIVLVGGLSEKVETARAISIDSATGQLTVRDSLDFETKNSYSFKVKASNSFASFGGSATIDVTVNVTDVAEAPTAQQSPAKTALLANYPNPFNPETWVPYQLSKSANVTLTIYNVKGEMVRHFAIGHQAAGDYRSRSRAIHWDGKNHSGEKVATGVYFYRFTAGDYSATRKMLIIK